MPEEMLEPPVVAEDAKHADGADSTSVWLLVCLIGMGVAICAFAAMLLPANPPLARADSLENWGFFGLRCVRDTLIALGIAGIGIVAATFVPRFGEAVRSLVFRTSRRTFLLMAVSISIVSSALFACIVMDRTTHIVDETAMLFQARILAGGRLTAPSPPVTDAFEQEFIITDPPGGRWYGKYFIGQSLLLVPGVWLSAPWLVHPVVIGICVWLTYLLGRELFNERTARIAVVLMTFSPLRLYTGGTMMGHAGSLLMLTLFALATVKVIKQPSRWGWGLVGGFFLGMAFNARPLTALAMGTAIGVIAALRFPWRAIDWRTVATFSGGLAFWAAVLFGYNHVLTGDALKTPFNEWSQTDRLGFGDDVGLEYWREEDKGHSLRRGLLIDSYYNLDVVGKSLTGWGRVTFALLLLGAIASRWRWQCTALLVVWLAVAAAHVFHVSSGVLMDQPRYWSEAMPMLLLAVAASLVVVRKGMSGVCAALGAERPGRTGRLAACTAGTVLVVGSLYVGTYPLVSTCHGWMHAGGVTFRELTARAGPQDALIFVHSGHYRSPKTSELDRYLAAFVCNDPDLSGPVVYARDLGPARNAEVIRHFPGRRLLWVDAMATNDMKLVPLEQAQSMPTP